MPRPKKAPKLRSGKKTTNTKAQYAALCYRKTGRKFEVLLITSRGTGRWILPKGWPMIGKTPEETAAQEAWEEAGVVGTPKDKCVGLYGYTKFEDSEKAFACTALVYPLKVKKLEDKFPEKGQRKRGWFSPKKASKRVAEPELARLLRNFDPRGL